MKKRLIAVIMALVVLLSTAGCGGRAPASDTAAGSEIQPTAESKPAEKNEKDDRVEITMYLWDKSMSKQLTPWLEKQFPDIKFTFVVGYNTMAYYTDLIERGASFRTSSPAAVSP